MFLCEDLAIKIVFSILFLSSTGNDNKSMNAEHGFVSSFATNNNIVSDANQGQSKLQKSITDSFAESCPFYLNTSKQCFPTLKKNNSSFELYNLTEQAKKQNLTAERKNLRLFAETSSGNNQTGIGLKVQAFFNESINYIFGLTESQKCFIAVTYLLALWKLHGARLWPIIFKVICKLFGKPKRAILRKISTNPSEKTILVQNDIARDDHVNIDDLTTDSSCESHLTTDGETTDSCDSHVESDEESIDVSGEEHVDTDYDSITTSSSVDDLPATSNNQTIPPTTIPTQFKLSLSFNSSDSLFEGSCDEDFPDEFFVFPSDCGNIGLILGDDDWEKIVDSSQESLISDDGCTASTGIESGQSYDVACDVDSRASSHSSCHSLVPKEVVSCLSCSSDGDPVTVATTSGCNDWIEENGDMNCSNNGNVDQWILECRDSNNYTPSNGCTSNVNHGHESTDSSLYDCDLTSEGLYEDSLELYPGEYAEHGISLQRSESESDIRIEVYNNIEPENLPAGDINRRLSADIENEIVEENIMDTTLEQRVKNHAVAAAIVAGTFVLPCFIAAKLLK
ncbi:Hypothetical predicted protein [Paramuricea clavata]|uniref:Uncharacterized protein n=1 Tax=Paramuricea clavata TaxID=317549 RepID=A0A7D9J3G0_PARCT|nr:Hypothetical predicted protein [Paramuricea clavata]